VQIHLQGATVPASIGDPVSVYAGFDGIPLEAPAGGFMQAAESMNRMLVTRTMELAACRDRHVLELFSGSGNVSVALARDARILETVESSGEAADAARRNLAARGLRAKVRVGDANALPISPAASVVVLDPPRSGASGATRAICASRARRVVMLSCDPATLARDVGQLTTLGRFRLDAIEVFEMFPHTSHMETLVVLTRNAGMGG